MSKKHSRNAQPPAADQPNGYDEVLTGISDSGRFSSAVGRFVAQAKGSPFSHILGSSEGKTPDTHLIRIAQQPELLPAFQLPWSHYVQLLAVHNTTARAFYEAEALRGGWSVRQLRRQIGSQFYERIRRSHLGTALAIMSPGGCARDPRVVSPGAYEMAALSDAVGRSRIEPRHAGRITIGRYRFTLAALMGAVALVAVGVAALRSPPPFGPASSSSWPWGPSAGRPLAQS